MSKIYMFVSYSRRDERWVKKGEHGLIPWLAQSLTRKDVEIWYDHALREMPGEDYKRKIKEEIDRAQFAILLISQEFLSSDFIRRYEMPWIKERVDRDEMTIIPILVDYTVWDLEDELKWIADRQMLPSTPTPLIEYTQNAAQWSRVRSQILQAILRRIQEVRRPRRKREEEVERKLDSVEERRAFEKPAAQDIESEATGTVDAKDETVEPALATDADRGLPERGQETEADSEGTVRSASADTAVVEGRERESQSLMTREQPRVIPVPSTTQKTPIAVVTTRAGEEWVLSEFKLRCAGVSRQLKGVPIQSGLEVSWDYIKRVEFGESQDSVGVPVDITLVNGRVMEERLNWKGNRAAIEGSTDFGAFKSELMKVESVYLQRTGPTVRIPDHPPILKDGPWATVTDWDGRLTEVTELAFFNSGRARSQTIIPVQNPGLSVELDKVGEIRFGKLSAGEKLIPATLISVTGNALDAQVDPTSWHLVGRAALGEFDLRIEDVANVTLTELPDDPRFRPDAWYLPDEPLLGFVEIPAGSFVMGEGEAQHEVTLPAYYIARYPVTVAQFRAFVEASGYELRNPHRLADFDNHPMVDVTWHEAMAYCEWLAERLCEWEKTPEPLAGLLRDQGWRVTLPSEAEWEKAARGTDGRTYPWGDDPDRDRVNYGIAGAGSSRTAVGYFPGGASPYLVEDLSGNVSEWTRSLFKDYPYDPAKGREDFDAKGSRVARRGGSIGYPVRAIHCAYRSGDKPYLFRGYVGFRVVLSHLL